MTKYLLGLILTLTLFGCKKNESEIISPKKDYTTFLAQTTQTFQGKLDGSSFSWSFGWNAFQGIKGYENGYGICDSTDPVRIVMFGLTSEGGGHTRFRLYSPKYNSTSDPEFSNVFSLGKKKLGNFRTDFYLSINQDNNFYQSNSNSSINEIEILKTQEYADYNGVKNLRVWFTLDAKLSSCNCQNNNTVLADGLMIAEFYGFKKGQ